MIDKDQKTTMPSSATPTPSSDHQGLFGGESAAICLNPQRFYKRLHARTVSVPDSCICAVKVVESVISQMITQILLSWVEPRHA